MENVLNVYRRCIEIIYNYPYEVPTTSDGLGALVCYAVRLYGRRSYATRHGTTNYTKSFKVHRHIDTHLSMYIQRHISLRLALDLIQK